MKTNHEELIEFVIERAPDLPVTRRAMVYRGLAEICGDQDEQRELRQLASSLEQTDALCRQFEFSFLQKRRA